MFRYFVFVGGALLALLFAVDFVLPASPVAQAVASAGNDQPMIRIRSDRHLPDRVVLDTSQPTVVPPTVTAAAQPPEQEQVSPALAQMSAKARVRETFAQFTPAPKADAKPQAQPEVALAQGPQAQPKRRVARAHPAPHPGQPVMLVAQQPRFGFFNTTW